MIVIPICIDCKCDKLFINEGVPTCCYYPDGIVYENVINDCPIADRILNKKLLLVTTKNDVKMNVLKFNEDLLSSDHLISKLSSFRNWYYIEELDLFGPSKFIGYKCNTSDNYVKGTDIESGYMDGRETNRELRQWFNEVDTMRYEVLYNKLSMFISNYDKKVNKIIKIYE